MTLCIDNSILSGRPRAPTPCDPCGLHSWSRGSSHRSWWRGETSPTPSFCFGDVYSWLMYPYHALLHAAGAYIHVFIRLLLACQRNNAIALSRGILRQYSTEFMPQRPYSKHYSNDLPSHINPITRINLTTWLLIRIIKTPLTGDCEPLSTLPTPSLQGQQFNARSTHSYRQHADRYNAKARNPAF